MATAKSRRRRALKSWAKHNLPEELWLEILSRLPAKSLVRFRSVSKLWKSMIDDHDFARLHLDRFNNGPESSRLFFVTGDSDECVVKNRKTLRTTRSLGFLESDLDSVNSLRTTPARSEDYRRIRSWSLISSIDGLFLLQSEEEIDLMLWNPSIKKTLALPRLKIPPDFWFDDCGLGFDSSIRDYKCVIFGANFEDTLKIAAIYTLGTNSWKTIEFQGDVCGDIDFDGGKRFVPFDGALYTLVEDVGPVKLVSFDLRREVFASIELPVVYNDFDEHSFDRALTMVYDDSGCGYSLGVVNITRPEGSVWILQRFGDDSKSWSWVPRYTFVIASQLRHRVWFIKFLCKTKNREMLWMCHDSVICYNLETQQEKRLLEKNRKTIDEGHVFPYVESLILLHH